MGVISYRNHQAARSKAAQQNVFNWHVWYSPVMQNMTIKHTVVNHRRMSGVVQTFVLKPWDISLVHKRGLWVAHRIPTWFAILTIIYEMAKQTNNDEMLTITVNH